MKKKIYLLSVALMLAFSTSHVNAAATITDPIVKETTLTDAQKKEVIQDIKDRVEQIKAMDKSQLSKEQKQELRTELKSMKAQARAVGGGGVYLSVGAIIIIILLLILILK